MTVKHVRQQIREEFGRLLGNLPSIGPNRTFVGRPYALTDDEIAGIFVVTPQEQSAPDTIGAVKLARTVTVLVLVEVVGPDAVDQLDRVALEVEEAVDAAIADRTSDLRGLAKDAQLRQSDFSIEGDGKNRSGTARLTYAVDYRTARGAPGTAIP